MGYYQGDFYEGDPFWGGLGRLVSKGVQLATGLKIGRQTKPGTALLAPAAAGMASLAKAHPTLTGVASTATQLIKRHPVISAAAAAGTIGLLGKGAMHPKAAMMMHPAMAGVRGFHMSKRTGAMVRNKRMRVTNPKALRRAIRRANGFARLARKVLRFTSPRAPKGRAVFKARRRKKV
jgi:hypothetical protein